MSTLLLLLLAPVLLPFSLAYRDGARSESCYGHEIEHISSNPMVGRLVRQDCLPPCNFDLILDGRVDAVSRAIEEDMVNDTLECGESYQCTYVSIDMYMYFFILLYQLHSFQNALVFTLQTILSVLQLLNLCSEISIETL